MGGKSYTMRDRISCAMQREVLTWAIIQWLHLISPLPDIFRWSCNTVLCEIRHTKKWITKIRNYYHFLLCFEEGYIVCECVCVCVRTLRNNTGTAAALTLWPCPFMKAWVQPHQLLIKGMYSTIHAHLMLYLTLQGKHLKPWSLCVKQAIGNHW